MLSSALHFPCRTFWSMCLLAAQPCLTAQPWWGDAVDPVIEFNPFIIETQREVNEPGALADRALPLGLPFSMSEGLTQVPGVAITRRGAFTAEPMIRGLGFDRVITRFNGLPLPNGSPTRTNAPVNQLWQLPQATLRISAAVPALSNGPPFTGGAIEFDTARTTTRPSVLDETEDTSLNVLISPGRHGGQWKLGVPFKSGGTNLGLSISGSDFGNYISGDGREVPSSHSGYGGALSLSTRAGEGGSHTFDVLYHQLGYTENASLPLDIDRGRLYVFTGVHLLNKTPADANAFRLRYGYSKSDTELSNRHRPTSPVRVVTHSETQSAHADAGATIVLGGGSSLGLGVDASQESRLAVRNRGALGQDFIWPDILYRQAGFYLESRTHFSETLSLRMGARLDHTRSAARQADQLAFGLPIHELYTWFTKGADGLTTKEDTGISANALLQFEPSGKVGLYAGIGSTAQAPPPTERYRAFLAAIGGGFEVGNPDLLPERKWEIAMGGRIRSGSLVLQADAFHFRVENFIWRQLAGDTSDILPLDPPQPVFSYRNVECAFTGLELQGHWQLHSQFRIPFSVAWINTELKESGPGFKEGDSIPELPPLECRISALWLWNLRSLAGSCQWTVHWVDSRLNPLPQIDPLYTRSPAYFLHDLNLSIRHPAGIEVSITLRNLFDEAYSPYLSPPVSSIRPASGDLKPGDRVPGPGRELILALQFAF